MTAHTPQTRTTSCSLASTACRSATVHPTLKTPIHAPGALSYLAAERAIASPRPIFVEGPSFSEGQVAWTATTGQGAGGSEADRVYLYNVRAGHLDIILSSHYGSRGFIAGYVLAGNSLAYVDTDVAPGGVFTWRVCIAILPGGHEHCIASSSPREQSTLAPQIAFDGRYLLMLDTINVSSTKHGSVALLFDRVTGRTRLLQQTIDVAFGDPALAQGTALWTVKGFAPVSSSLLMACDERTGAVRLLPVGSVSQVSARGTTIVWKSGVGDLPGHIGVYDLSSHRSISQNLAEGTHAAYPSVGGHVVSWTYSDGSKVQIYDLSARRLIYTSPVVPGRIYAQTAANQGAVSWLYAVTGDGPRQTRGYVVIHPLL